MSERLEQWLRPLRVQAEPLKSFPVAVYALVRAALDRGATKVEIVFDPSQSGHPCVEVSDDGELIGKQEIARFVGEALTVSKDSASLWILAGIHHGSGITVCTANEMTTILPGMFFGVEIKWFPCTPSPWNNQVMIHLDSFDGVNPRQDRSMARLLKRLPALLTPGQAAKVRIMDEEGRRHELLFAETISDTFEGYRLRYPIELTNAELMKQSGELRLEYNGQVVTMREFAARLPAMLAFGLVYLQSPWLRGVIEVREPVGLRAIGQGGSLAGMRNETFCDEQLARALALSAISARAKEQIHSVARGYISYEALGRSDVFEFNGRRWIVGLFSQSMPGQCGAVWIEDEFDSPDLITPINIDPTHPLFHVDSNPRAVGERMLFAIAEVLRERFDLAMPVTGVYLDLRAAIAKTRAS